MYAYVQVLASLGDEIALYYALFSTKSVNLLIVSPLLRGSNPYPNGSLTYRNYSLVDCSICIRFYFVNTYFDILRRIYRIIYRYHIKLEGERVRQVMSDR